MLFVNPTIDGTVAGTPEDLTIYVDGSSVHDHTYYGRGCKNAWGTSGEGGSQTPCADSDAGGRYVETDDGETQKNGTYYHFQAATSGTGGTLSTNNANTPDTFCPLGWQMPYSGTGGDYYDQSKSWDYLFTTYGIEYNTGTSESVTKVKSYPFSYVFSGHTQWGLGRLYVQKEYGYYWSSTLVSNSSAYNMNMWVDGERVVNPNNKAFGAALRCVSYFSIPHRRHGGRNNHITN